MEPQDHIEAPRIIGVGINTQRVTKRTKMALENVSVDDYLDMIGFRPKGTRGRLSEDCKQAVEMALAAGMTFCNWDADKRMIVREKAAPKPRAEKKKSVMSAPEVKSEPVVRGANTIQILDEDGVVSNFQTHSWGCGKAISRCTCRNIGSPAYLRAKKVELVIL